MKFLDANHPKDPTRMYVQRTNEGLIDIHVQDDEAGAIINITPEQAEELVIELQELIKQIRK